MKGYQRTGIKKIECCLPEEGSSPRQLDEGLRSLHECWYQKQLVSCRTYAVLLSSLWLQHPPLHRLPQIPPPSTSAQFPVHNKNLKRNEPHLKNLRLHHNKSREIKQKMHHWQQSNKKLKCRTSIQRMVPIYK
jgi:hypothetical protein